MNAAAVGPSSATRVPTGTLRAPPVLQPPATTPPPSGSKRIMFEVCAPSRRPSSSVTTANTRAGSASRATTVATRRSAACSAASVRSSSSLRCRSVTSRRKPVKSGGPGRSGRLIAISTGNSLPSERMAGSSTGCPTMLPCPVAT